MDAINRKSLASVFVTLLVGSVFLAAIVPTAEAQTDAPDVAIDVRPETNPDQTVTVAGVGQFPNIVVPTNPSGFMLQWGTAYDLMIVGVNLSGTTGTGYAPTNTAKLALVNATGTPLTLATADVGPGPTSAHRNATFLIGIATVPGPGVYEIRPLDSANNPLAGTIARLFFYPKADITVTTPAAVTYNPASNTVVTINTRDGTTGAGMVTNLYDCAFGGSSGCLNFIHAPGVTGADGNFVFLSTTPMGVGTWAIFASTNNSGPQTSPTTTESIPERLGNNSFVVNPVTLGLSPIQNAPFVGFPTAVAFRPTYTVTGNSVFKATSGVFPTDVVVNRINITVGSPTGWFYAYNTTFSSIGTSGVFNADGSLAEVCWNATVVSCGTVGTTIPDVNIDLNTGGIWLNATEDIDGSNVWTTGQYQLWIQLETAGGTIGGGTLGSMTPPEYTVSQTITPGAPAAVNLQISPATVDVPAATGTIPITNTVPNAAQGTVTSTLTISGNTAFRHPLCDRLDAGSACGAAITNTTVGGTWENLADDFRDNITLRGDLLPGWNITSYDPTTGVAMLRFTPSAFGNIWVDVAWKNVTTSVQVPVQNGANITLDVANVTVDITSTITAHVRNAFGGNVENANVYVFPKQVITGSGALPFGSYAGTGSAVVFGTGAPNTGQGGLYVFNLKPSTVQDLVFYAVVGGGTSNTNYSYAPLQVLPNNDLIVSPNVTQTMAALRTQVVLNISNTTAAQTATAANFKLFLLSATQRQNLVANGTTALFTTGTVPTPFATTGNTAFGTVVNVTQNAGDYYWYACSATGTVTATCGGSVRDNRNNMPVLNVSAYRLTFSPTQLANNPDIQGATTFNVKAWDRTDNLSNGTITVRTNTTYVVGGSTFSATLTNGQANITLTGANGGIGTLEFNFNPKEATGADDAATDRALGGIEVVAGNLSFSPTKVPILQSTLITARLTNFTGAGLGGREIRICSVSLNPNWNAGSSSIPAVLGSGASPPADITNCPAVGVTESDGSTGIVVSPNALSPLHVYVNKSYTGRTILVTAGTLTVTVSPTSPTVGSDVTISAFQPGGVASAGIRILVLRNGTQVLDQTTDANGQATLADVTAGNYTVTALRSGFDNGTASFRVGGNTTPPANNTARFVLSNLVIPATVNVGSPASVTVTVTNSGTANGTATAVLLVNNAQAGSQSVTLAAGATQTLTYTFTPTVAGNYSVRVVIGDVTIGPQDVIVGTPPTTTTPVSSTPVSSTPVSSTPVSSTPVTSTPVTTPEPTVPGFEVVALLAALGVALLVLRRK